MISAIFSTSGSRTEQAVLTIAGAVFAFSLYKLLSIGNRDRRLPPGPPTVPILGNLLDVPKTGLALKSVLRTEVHKLCDSLTIRKRLKEWSQQYGGVFSLKFGPETVIVLFDRKAVYHLLDKKGNIYSERPRSYVPNLVTGGDSFAFMDSTPLWRSERKVAAHNLSVSKFYNIPFFSMLTLAV
jgi:hypothetical protein